MSLIEEMVLASVRDVYTINVYTLVYTSLLVYMSSHWHVNTIELFYSRDDIEILFIE